MAVHVLGGNVRVVFSSYDLTEYAPRVAMAASTPAKDATSTEDDTRINVPGVPEQAFSMDTFYDSGHEGILRLRTGAGGAGAISIFPEQLAAEGSQAIPNFLVNAETVYDGEVGDLYKYNTTGFLQYRIVKGISFSQGLVTASGQSSVFQLPGPNYLAVWHGLNRNLNLQGGTLRLIWESSPDAAFTSPTIRLDRTYSTNLALGKELNNITDEYWRLRWEFSAANAQAEIYASLGQRY